MPTQISPMLAVTDGSAAIEFYEAAFGADLLWKLGEGADVVAGLSIDGAPFFIAYHAPEYGTRGPASVGFSTVRIELFVDDPVAVQEKVLTVGAVEHSPIEEHEHPTTGAQIHPTHASGRCNRPLRPHLADRQIPRIAAGFICEPLCPLWFSNRVPMELSDGSFRTQ